MARSAVGLCAFAAPALANAQQADPVRDSLYRRAAQLVNEGQGNAGRMIVDSLLRAAPSGSAAYADGLYWRARLATDATAARRDYVTIIVEHALSPRAADALLELAQLEMSLGNRGAAISYLDRLVLEHRDAAVAPAAWYWLGRLRMEDGDLALGCAALDSARRRLSPADVERQNQLEYAARICRDGAAVAAPGGRGAAPPPVTPPPTGVHWTVQVAAFRTETEAERYAGTLRARGYEARVEFVAPFHRVRIGRYPSRDAAAAVVSRLRQERIEAIIVETGRQ